MVSGTVGFLDQIVLLSSAVADADNQVMTSGKKLELLAAIDQQLTSVPKAEISSAQKKLEDLCLRMLFQDCPAVIARLIVRVLNTAFSRGSSASMHALVAFLLQLSMFSPKDAGKLDRPIPGRDEDENDPKPLSVQEKAVCFTVAVGIVVARGPSASYFVPNIIACMHKHVKLPDPAARESALRALRAVIQVIGVPGSSVGSDVFKHFLYRGVYGEKSPQVRIAAAHGIAAFCLKCPVVALANADTIQGLALKVILSSAAEMKSQAVMGPLLVELRHSHAQILLQLLLCAIQSKRDKEETLSASSVKNVTSFPSAIAFLTILVKKYRAAPHAVEALTSVAVRLALILGEREDDLLFIGKSIVSEIAPVSVSVATRAFNRVLRAGDGDSGTLRIVSEIVMPTLRQPPLAEQSIYVCLAALVEAMAIVEGSISALDSSLASDLVQLITATRSAAVAVNAAYALRALCRVAPSQSFALANVLLNHITIQLAELSGSTSSEIAPVYNFSLALASVLCECVGDLPQDLVGAVVSTAQALIGSEETASGPTEEWTKRTAGFTLLTPVIAVAPTAVLAERAVAFFGLWKTVLGKKTKEGFAAAVAPGTVIQNVSPVIESLQTVLAATRSLREFLARSGEWLKGHPDGEKMALMLLNNVWQISQLAVPLEQSGASPVVTIVVHGIRAELFQALLAVPVGDAMGKPLAAFLASEMVKPSVLPISPHVLFDSLVKQKSHFASALLETADSILEEQGEADTLLSVAVESSLRALGGQLSARDYFASPISAGTLEDYYAVFPTSRGSPVCPLVPFLATNNCLLPLASQMTHPVMDARKFGTKLLANLLVSLEAADMCVAALASSYKQVEQVFSLEFEAAKENNGKPQSLGRANLVVAVVTACFTLVCEAPGSRETGALWLKEIASGLGALHPFTRRASAVAIAALYRASDGQRDLIFQCITDSAVSKSARTRSAAGLLIAFLVEFSPLSLVQVAPSLFKLTRELTAPTRVSALFALLTVSRAARNSMAPWTKEVLKVVTAHLVADVYPNSLAGALLAGVVAAIFPVAAMSSAEADKSILLWSQLTFADEEQSGSLALLTKRFSVALASQAGNDKRIAGYVIDRIGESIESSMALCRDSLVALTEIVELSQSVPITFDFYDALFSVSDLNPALRSQVDQLLKCMLRDQGAEALPYILNSLGSQGAQAEALGGEEDDRGDEDDYDSDHEERSKRNSPTKQNAPQRVQVTQKTKALMLKCVKRIFKLSGVNSKQLFGSNLEQLINVGVSAVAGESAPALALQGAKLIAVLVDAFGSDIVRKPHSGEDDSLASGGGEEEKIPLLLQYETQIMSALRRGVKSNSDAAPAVQRVCLEILKTVLSLNLTSSAEKMVELLVQPLVLVEPATMPWSTFFALRETGNTILSGRSGLGQSNEREVSLVLYARIAVIVDLLDSGVAAEELRKHASYIHYFLLRLLVDSAIVSGGDLGGKFGNNLFSLLDSDRDALAPVVATTLVPTVLNGLAVLRDQSWGDLTCPADCPFRRQVDMEALFVGATVAAAQHISSVDALDALARPIGIVAFEFGHPELLRVFDLRLPVGSQRGSCRQLLKFAHRVAIEEHRTVPAGTVWRLARLGMTAEPTLGQLGDVVKFLLAGGFFSTPGAAQELISDCLYVLVQKHPQALVRLLREAVTEIADVRTCLELVEAVTELLGTVDVNVQFCLVLLIPLFGKLVALAEADVTGSTRTLLKLRRGLIAIQGENGMVIQGLGKLLAVTPVPEVVVKQFFIPTVVDLITRSPDDAVHLLVSLVPLVDKQAEEWKEIVSFVMELAALEELNEEHMGKTLLLCMQPVDIFKECLGNLSAEAKGRVEVLVRKYMPKRDGSPAESEKETAQVASAAAPQIQLKLKFGKD